MRIENKVALQKAISFQASIIAIIYTDTKIIDMQIAKCDPTCIRYCESVSLATIIYRALRDRALVPGLSSTYFTR